MVIYVFYDMSRGVNLYLMHSFKCPNVKNVDKIESRAIERFW
jgi:hypothetical protein